MRGQETYSNHLSRECPGLDERARFAYETATGRLCNNDMITLLERGSQLSPGITCRLGKFVRASAEEVVDLTLGENRHGTRPNAIEVRRAELPPATDTDAAIAPPSPTDAPFPPDAPAPGDAPVATDGDDE
jgi:hypothetical protein